MDVTKEGNLNSYPQFRKAYHRVRKRALLSTANYNQHLKTFITNWKKSYKIQIKYKNFSLGKQTINLLL